MHGSITNFFKKQEHQKCIERAILFLQVYIPCRSAFVLAKVD